MIKCTNFLSPRDSGEIFWMQTMAKLFGQQSSTALTGQVGKHDISELLEVAATSSL